MNSPSGSAVWAMNGGTNAGQATAVAGGSLFLCCFRDLCNHVDSPQSHLRLNDTVAGMSHIFTQLKNCPNQALYELFFVDR